MKKVFKTLNLSVIFLFIGQMLLPAPVNAQTQSKQFPQETLADRIERIQLATKRNIVYESKSLGDIQVPALHAQNNTVEQLLDKSLSSTEFTYKKTADNSIVITKKIETSKNVVSRGKGTISGIVLDEKSQPITGATINVQGTAIGVISDSEGKYALRGVPAGETIIEARFLSYQTSRVQHVKVNAGRTTLLNLVLKESSKELGEVVVTGSYSNASAIGLYAAQKMKASMSDGISSDLIKKTGDNNIAQVLKRVSGVTIQDNKFVTVRGMSERYNNVQLNGASLPSTEPNRRNFSFDIIPSNLVDNITVSKTFTPDMQGEFTGGMVEITTLAIPKKKFLTLSVGSGFNTNSTGKDFWSNTRFKSDYFLGNSSERNWYNRDWINDEYSSYFDQSTSKLKPEYVDKAHAMNAKIPNHWGLNKYTAVPMQNYAFSMGKPFNLGNGNSLGITLATTYRHEENVETTEEALYNSGPTETKNAHNYKFMTSVGAVANIGWERPGHKITLRNLFNNRFTHENIERVLFNRYDGSVWLDQYSSPMRNTLWQTRLEGEHKLLDKLTFTWFADYNKLNRLQPEDRLIRGVLGSASYMEPFPSSYLDSKNRKANWTGLFNTNALGNAHIMHSSLNENKKSIGGNLEVPFVVKGNMQKLKAGYWGTFRKAGYTQQFLSPQWGGDAVNNKDVELLSLHSLMAPENFANGILTYEFAGGKGPEGDYYNGRQNIHAAYLMGDFTFFNKLHLTGGIRMESAHIEVDTRFGFQNSPTTTRYADSTVVRKKNDWLPSVTAVYNVTDKVNIRAAYSKTLARPDFRELTRYNYYNVNDRMEVASSHALTTTYTKNYDLRLEWYPQAGEVVSLSAFYKYFDNPVEMLSYNPAQSGNYVLTPSNLKSSTMKGLELNLRKSFGFMAPGTFLKDLYLTANATLLKGNIKYNSETLSQVSDKVSGTDRNRPLMGMAPYAVNAGLDYQNSKLGMAVNYGTTGRKITFAGPNVFEDEYEAPRHVLDFQISYRLLKGRLEMKANASDLLNQAIIVYDNKATFGENYGKDGNFTDYTMGDMNYNKGEDLLRRKIRKGTSYSLSVNYNF